MNRTLRRRDFLRQAGAGAAGFWAVTRTGPSVSRSPNEKLNIACIGLGGMGGGNLNGVSGENVTALCDPDSNFLDKAAAGRPAAKKFADYRRMFEEIPREFDAVVISTPDHHHAPAAMAALRLGKHCYCEKPLTHGVYEARQVAEAARKAKVATQMGNRGTSGEEIRRVVELVQAGAIGAVKEVHCWTNRPIWPQGLDRPPARAVPKNLNWDLWLGPAPQREYHDSLHPFSWRGWWDFGTGALGDMACHIMNTPYWALKLGHPSSVEAEGEPRKPDCGPLWMTVRYEFPAQAGRPPLRLVWYDGKKNNVPNLPPEELAEGAKISPDGGTLFVGEKGKLLGAQLLPADRSRDFKPPPATLPRVPDGNHYNDWIRACKGQGPACSHFDFAGPLTEGVLLGIVAFRAGKKLPWDGPAMKARGCPEAERYVRRPYRKGWTL